MNSPLVSVIIPTFNRKARILIAARSVLSQTYQNLELIVVDDGSTDGTPAAIKTIQDKRLQTIIIEHSGVSRARNCGVRISNGEYIAFLDSDDSWHREKLEQQLCFHQIHPELSISQTQEIWIRNGKRVNPGIKHRKSEGYIFLESLNLCTITPSSVFLTRKLFESYGGFDKDLPACEDYDLWLKITAKHHVGLLDELLLTKHGGHSDQLSQFLPAMDRYRIYSLGNILLSGLLDLTQSQQAKTVLERKIEILKQGAQKRENGKTALITFLSSLNELKYSKEQFKEQAKYFLLSPIFSD